MRKILLLIVVLISVGCSIEEKEALSIGTSKAVASEKTKACLDCHTKKTPGVVATWQVGRMAEKGVGCFECHEAQDEDIDAVNHFGNTIAVIVSPEDCGKCHSAESEEFLGSHHAAAGQVLGSLDNYLGEVVEGLPASVSGCQQCHGSYVEVDYDGKLTADTWPNFGVGRVNPDGTSGTCSACHGRHDFSLAQVRTPETCGKCHMGPDHPQMEIYSESKHNIAYQTHMEQMNMDSREWIVGEDYSAAPTCATCHVSATPNQSVTHDMADRMSWNLKPAISVHTENWEKNRSAMKEVCMNCHNPDYVDNHFVQLDAGIDLYNNKFAIPAKQIMDALKDAGKIDSISFNEKIEWTYFELWHHEGRRARNGLAMSGPDYVQWHGFYEVARNFYTEFIPEAEELLHGVSDEVLSRPEHSWFSGEMSKEIREAVINEYKVKYGEE